MWKFMGGCVIGILLGLLTVLPPVHSGEAKKALTIEDLPFSLGARPAPTWFVTIEDATPRKAGETYPPVTEMFGETKMFVCKNP